jgi:hypothetical protein
MNITHRKKSPSGEAQTRRARVEARNEKRERREGKKKTTPMSSRRRADKGESRRKTGKNGWK